MNIFPQVAFTGSRYKLSGLVLPLLRPWMMEAMGIDVTQTSFSVESIDLKKIPTPILNEKFCDEMHAVGIELSHKPMDRLVTNTILVK